VAARVKNGGAQRESLAPHDSPAGRRVVVVIDVTERTRAREALAKSTERLNLLHEIERAIIAAKAPVEIAEAALHGSRICSRSARDREPLRLEAGQVEWLAATGRRRRMYRGPPPLFVHWRVT